jgi:serine-type D-Ala-D-Ala carboxypeptidase/endopeptidase
MMRTALVLLVAVAACAADRKAAIDQLVQPVIESGSAPGVVVGVVEGGKSQIFGYGKGVGEQAPDGSTVFEIGSATNTFTTLALAAMVENKMVALEDPVRNYLPPDTIPAGKAGVAEIRLIDLATQSSGLPRLPLNMHPGDTTNPYADYTPQLLYEFLVTQTLRLNPNANFLYGTLNMGLLGHALSLRYGKTYEQMIAELVAMPLGLNDTRVTLTEDQRKRLAPGHDGDGKVTRNWDYNALAGAGALRSTAADLVRYVQAQIDPPEKMKAAIELQHMERRKIGAFGSIALAWIIKPDGKTYWQNGGTAGYSAYVSFSPERKTGVVVLVNNGSLFMDQIGNRVEQMLAGETVQPMTLHHAVPLDSKTLDEYVGAYEVVPGVRFNITRQGEQMFGQFAGNAPLAMYPEVKDKFFLRIIVATVDFERGPDGQITGVVLHQGGRDTKAKRVAAQ